MSCIMHVISHPPRGPFGPLNRVQIPHVHENSFARPYGFSTAKCVFSRFHVFTAPFPRPNVHFHVFTFHSTRFHGQMCIFTFCAFTKYISKVKYVFSRFYVSHGIVFSPNQCRSFFQTMFTKKHWG